jgi:hypothetical protein
LSRQPTTTYKYQDHLREIDCLPYLLGPLLSSERDHIDKNLILTKVRTQAIGKPSNCHFRVLASIADEDTGHNNLLRVTLDRLRSLPL